MADSAGMADPKIRSEDGARAKARDVARMDKFYYLLFPVYSLFFSRDASIVISQFSLISILQSTFQATVLLLIRSD